MQYPTFCELNFPPALCMALSTIGVLSLFYLLCSLGHSLLNLLHTWRHGRPLPSAASLLRPSVDVLIALGLFIFVGLFL